MSGNNIVFHDKLEAYGNVVTEYLPNGLSINSGASADTGNVYIPTVSGGCSSTTSADKLRIEVCQHRSLPAIPMETAA
jgi:hypothetical protein